MIALLIATVALGAGPTEFETAYGMAADDVGTDQFASSFAMAKALCTKIEYKCVSRIAELRQQDAEQRRDTAVVAPPAATLPAAQAKDDSSDEDDQGEDEGYVLTRFTTVPPAGGADFVGGYTDPGGDWIGVQVQDIKQNWPRASFVCAMKGGAPITFGPGGTFTPEIPTIDSDTQGSPIMFCPAAVVNYEGVYVPSGTTLQVLEPRAKSVDTNGDGISDDTIVLHQVVAVYKCDVSSYFRDRVQSKGILGCSAIRR